MTPGFSSILLIETSVCLRAARAAYELYRDQVKSKAVLRKAKRRPVGAFPFRAEAGVQVDCDALCVLSTLCAVFSVLRPRPRKRFPLVGATFGA